MIDKNKLSPLTTFDTNTHATVARSSVKASLRTPADALAVTTKGQPAAAKADMVVDAAQVQPAVVKRLGEKKDQDEELASTDDAVAQEIQNAATELEGGVAPAEDYVLLAQAKSDKNDGAAALEEKGAGDALLGGGRNAGLGIVGGALLLGMAGGGGGGGGGGNPPPPPPELEITAVIDNFPVAGQTVNIADGGRTNDATPLIQGVGRAGKVVVLTVNGDPLAEVTVGQDGTWSYQVTDELDGEINVETLYTFRVVYKDATPGFDERSINLIFFQLDSYGEVTSLVDDVNFYQGDLLSNQGLVDGNPSNETLWTNDGLLSGTVRVNFLDQNETLPITKVEVQAYLNGVAFGAPVVVYNGAGFEENRTFGFSLDLVPPSGGVNAAPNTDFSALTLVVRTYSGAEFLASETLLPDFRLDNVKPLSPDIERVWTSDPGSSTTGPVTVYVSGSITNDSGSPVTRIITVLEDDIADQEFVPTKRYESAVTASTFNIQFAAMNVPNVSVYQIATSAVDEAGNTSIPDKVTVVMGTNTGNDVINVPSFIGSGAGKSELINDTDGVLIFAFDGQDTITGTSGGDVIYSGKGKDVVYGMAGNDWIYGGDDDSASQDQGDYLDGGAGNDRLFGENQKDTLVGGAGSDILVGGLGADLIDLSGDDGSVDYVYYAESSSPGSVSNLDSIVGFVIGQDKVGVSIGDIRIDSSQNVHTLSNTKGVDISSVVSSAGGWTAAVLDNDADAINATTSSAYNVIILTATGVNNAAAAFGTSEITNISGLSSGSGRNKVAGEGVLTVFYNDDVNKMVIGYVVDDSSPNKLNAADAFYTIAEVGYTYTDSAAFISAVANTLVLYNPTQLVPPDLIA